MPAAAAGRHRKERSSVLQFSEDDIPMLTETFNAYSNNSKHITAEGIKGVVRLLGVEPNHSDVIRFIDRLDLDGNGSIELNEFLAFMLSLRKERFGEDYFTALLSAFQWFDKDKNGTIEREELTRVLTQMGDPLSDQEAEDFISSIDLNNDGHLSIPELIVALRDKKVDLLGRKDEHRHHVTARRPSKMALDLQHFNRRNSHK